MVIMSLVVFIPLIAGVNPIVVFRLPRAVLLMPPIDLALHLYLPSKWCIT